MEEILRRIREQYEEDLLQERGGEMEAPRLRPRGLSLWQSAVSTRGGGLGSNPLVRSISSLYVVGCFKTKVAFTPNSRAITTLRPSHSH
jgi:hypothetical protein